MHMSLLVHDLNKIPFGCMTLDFSGLYDIWHKLHFVTSYFYLWFDLSTWIFIIVKLLVTPFGFFCMPLFGVFLWCDIDWQQALPVAEFLWLVSCEILISDVRCEDSNLTIVNMTYATTGNQFNDTLTYSCLEGFTHTYGDLQRRCDHLGVWTGTRPICGKYNAEKYRFLTLFTYGKNMVFVFINCVSLHNIVSVTFFVKNCQTMN